MLYEQKWSASEQHKHTFHLEANISFMCICAWLKSSYRRKFVRTLDWTFSASERIIRMGCMSKNDRQLNSTITRVTSSKWFCQVYFCLTEIFISKINSADAWLDIFYWEQHQQHLLYERKRSAVEQHNHTSNLGPNGSVMCYCAGLKFLYQIWILRKPD